MFINYLQRPNTHFKNSHATPTSSRTQIQIYFKKCHCNGTVESGMKHLKYKNSQRFLRLNHCLQYWHPSMGSSSLKDKFPSIALFHKRIWYSPQWILVPIPPFPGQPCFGQGQPGLPAASSGSLPSFQYNAAGGAAQTHDPRSLPKLLPVVSVRLTAFGKAPFPALTGNTFSALLHHYVEDYKHGYLL